jgi:hypothetical protein
MSQVGYGFMVAIPALFLARIFQWLLVDPLATVAMVVSFNMAIEGQQPSYDLRGQLAGVSSRFRQLTEHSGVGAVQPLA